MTFLELCQEVARESGTVSGTAPASVTNQVGQLRDIVLWTRDAWLRVQRQEPWSFMLQEFTADLAIGTARYSADALGLTDVAEFMRHHRGDNAMSIYDTAIGESDEGPLRFLDYADFFPRFVRGGQRSGKPVAWSITNDGQFILSSAPEDAYTLRGFYRRRPQMFSANGDKPTGLSDEFHMVIVHVALTELAEFDEAPVTLSAHTQRRREILSQMRDRYLPIPQFARITLG